jgi:hypothetical protein
MLNKLRNLLEPKGKMMETKDSTTKTSKVVRSSPSNETKEANPIWILM